MSDTIVALSTPFGVSAIAKIRVSGELVPLIASAALCKEQPQSHRAFLANYTSIGGDILDQVIGIFFEGKKAYTGEDSLEIDCHGSPLIIRAIIDDIIARGARMAEPGEYTKRAFLHKKLDLCQAEAVLDVIHAKNQDALRIAQKQLQGKLSEKIWHLSDCLLNILANLESYIDFSDDDIEHTSSVEDMIKEVQTEINDILSTHRYHSSLQDGLSVAIVGAPNAGKSSLLNALLHTDRALVSDIPGTTRDFISETVHIGPYALRIIDTAGLRDTNDRIEQLGIKKSIENIQSADICLLIHDYISVETLCEEIVNEIQKKPCILLINKLDLLDSGNCIDQLNQKTQESRVSHKDEVEDGCVDCASIASVLRRYHFVSDVVYISAQRSIGLAYLERALVRLISNHDLLPRDQDVVINVRHKEIFLSVRECISRALDVLLSRGSYELCASDIRESLEVIGQITGKYNNEDMLSRIFSQFCVGK